MGISRFVKLSRSPCPLAVQRMSEASSRAAASRSLLWMRAALTCEPRGSPRVTLAPRVPDRGGPMRRRLVLVVEGTAVQGGSFPVLRKLYIEPLITYAPPTFPGNLPSTLGAVPYPLCSGSSWLSRALPAPGRDPALLSPRIDSGAPPPHMTGPAPGTTPPPSQERARPTRQREWGRGGGADRVWGAGAVQRKHAPQHAVDE